MTLPLSENFAAHRVFHKYWTSHLFKGSKIAFSQKKKTVTVSYSGPREDVSLQGRGGVAPEGLQTDILPRSRVGDTHSPYHAMMASEVKAASIRKNRANPGSPAMRDSVYEVKSPCTAMQYTEFRSHFQAIFVQWHSPNMPMPCWPLWKTRQPQSSLKAASKGGHLLFFKYFLYQNSIAQFHSIFVGILCFEVAVSSEDVHRDC